MKPCMTRRSLFAMGAKGIAVFASSVPAIPAKLRQVNSSWLTKRTGLTVRNSTAGSLEGIEFSSGMPTLRVGNEKRSTRLSLLVPHRGATIGQILLPMEWVVNSTWTIGDTETPHLRTTSADKARREVALAKASRAGRNRLMSRWNQVRRYATFGDDELSQLAKVEPGLVECLRHPASGKDMRMGLSLPESFYGQLFSQGVVRVPVANLSVALQERIASNFYLVP